MTSPCYNLIGLLTFWDDKSKWDPSWPREVPESFARFIKRCGIFPGTYGKLIDDSFRFDEFHRDAVALAGSMMPADCDASAAFVRAVTQTWMGGNASAFVGNESVVPMLLLVFGRGDAQDLRVVQDLASNPLLPIEAATVLRRCIAETLASCAKPDQISAILYESLSIRLEDLRQSGIELDRATGLRAASVYQVLRQIADLEPHAANTKRAVRAWLDFMFENRLFAYADLWKASLELYEKITDTPLETIQEEYRRREELRKSESASKH